MEFHDLTALRAYSNFVKSPQYKQWLAYLASKEKRQKKQGQGVPADKAKQRAPAKA
jgi:hypothetical protein